MRPDGEARTIEAVGEVRCNETGQATSVLAVGLDVTEQRRAAEEMASTRVRLAHERATVETLAQSLRPVQLPSIPGAKLAARYRPAASGDHIGGDFYDIFPVDETTWLLLVGDVSGKGPEAAALSALARYTVRADARRETRPGSCSGCSTTR